MSRRCLESARDVVDALGGIAAVAALTGSRPKAVSAWLSEDRSLPAKFYVVMTEALAVRGYVAPAALWQQAGLDRASAALEMTDVMP